MTTEIETSSDTDRRFLAEAVRFGLLDEQTARLALQWRIDADAAGARAPSAARTLCERGVISPAQAAAILHRVRAARTERAPARDPTREHRGGDGGPRLEVGARLGGHRLLDELGRGGMGAVWRVRHEASGVVRALKVILPQGGAIDPEDVLRFRREAELLARVAPHPGVVPIHEVGEVDGLLYCVMALVEGAPLSTLTGDGPMPADDAARIVAGIARAIAHVHRHGVLHRDLKPANVIIDPAGAPHVLDFGLAVDLRATRLTRAGDILGTPAFMAPEQVDPVIAGAEISECTDVYGLGAILHATLTGRPPFAGADPLWILQQVLSDWPTAPSSIEPSVPRELEAVCLKALAKAPADRYPSAEALADDLERWRAGESTTASPLGALERRRRRLVGPRAGRLRRLLPELSAFAIVATALVGGALLLDPYGLGEGEKLAARVAAAEEKRDDALAASDPRAFDAATAELDRLVDERLRAERPDLGARLDLLRTIAATATADGDPGNDLAKTLEPRRGAEPERPAEIEARRSDLDLALRILRARGRLEPIATLVLAQEDDLVPDTHDAHLASRTHLDVPPAPARVVELQCALADLAVALIEGRDVVAPDRRLRLAAILIRKLSKRAHPEASRDLLALLLAGTEEASDPDAFPGEEARSLLERLAALSRVAGPAALDAPTLARIVRWGRAALVASEESPDPDLAKAADAVLDEIIAVLPESPELEELAGEMLSRLVAPIVFGTDETRSVARIEQGRLLHARGLLPGELATLIALLRRWSSERREAALDHLRARLDLGRRAEPETRDPAELTVALRLLANDLVTNRGMTVSAALSANRGRLAIAIGAILERESRSGDLPGAALSEVARWLGAAVEETSNLEGGTGSTLAGLLAAAPGDANAPPHERIHALHREALRRVATEPRWRREPLRAYLEHIARSPTRGSLSRALEAWQIRPSQSQPATIGPLDSGEEGLLRDLEAAATARALVHLDAGGPDSCGEIDAVIATLETQTDDETVGQWQLEVIHDKSHGRWSRVLEVIAQLKGKDEYAAEFLELHFGLLARSMLGRADTAMQVLATIDVSRITAQEWRDVGAGVEDRAPAVAAACWDRASRAGDSAGADATILATARRDATAAGRLWQTAGESRRAAASFERAAELAARLDPPATALTAELWRWAGDALANAGDPEGALTRYRNAIEAGAAGIARGHRRSFIATAMALERAAQAHEQLGRTEEARRLRARAAEVVASTPAASAADGDGADDEDERDDGGH